MRPALAAIDVPQKLMISALLESGQKHVFDRLPKDKVKLKKEEESNADVGVAEAVLSDILGSSFFSKSFS